MAERQRTVEDLGMTPLADFYRARRVFVTGHTGFKGGWLSTWLKMMGAHVTGFGLPPHGPPSFFEAAHVAHEIDSLIGDIRDFETVRSALNDSEPSIVFHMAAQPLVRHSYDDPVATYATNVMGTVHLLEAVRQVESVRAVVVVTSDKCYENREWVWGYRENEPMGGFDPYSSSKGCAELVTAAYRQSFFSQGRTAVATARAGNVIGGGDWSKDRLVPDIVRAVLNDEPVIVRHPTAVRPWQHVLEPLSGYLRLAERLCSDDGNAWAGAWNFGPNADGDTTVENLVRKALESWGRGELAVHSNPNAPHEAGILRLDSSKARSQLQWRPTLSVQQAIEWTVDWYRGYADTPETSESKTHEQIERFVLVI
jgi:CDP-glucose 4,6-dehydratase